MNYNIIQSLESPRTGGRALITNWTNRMADQVLTNIAATVNGNVFVLQNKLWSQPQDDRVVAIEGNFPADVEGSHNQFSLIFSSKPNNEKLTALTERYMAVTRYLAPGGFLVLDIDKSVIKSHTTIWAGRIYQVLKNVRVTDSAYGTLTITGVKRGNDVADDLHVQSVTEFLNFAKNNETDFPGVIQPFRVALPNTPNAENRIFFRSKSIDMEVLENKAAGLPWDMRRISQDVFGWKRPPVFPAMALRAKLYGALMASGVLGSLRLTSPVTGHTCIVRGDSRRVERERDLNEEKQQIGSFESLINVLDLETGELTTYDPQKAGQVRVFLEEWAESLADRLQEAFPVAYDPINAPYSQVLKPLLRNVIDKSFFGRGVRNLSSGVRPSLTTTQKHVCTALLIKSLGKRAVLPDAPQYDDLPAKGNHAVVLSGDPGSGKTFTSIRWLEGLVREYADRHKCSIHAGGWPLSVVITPPANVPGFEKSINTASTFFATRIVYRVDELYQAMKEAKTAMTPLVIIIPRTRMRQSQGIKAVYRLDEPPFEEDHGYLVPSIICPTCGASVSCPSCRTKNQENIQQIAEEALTDTVRLRGKNCDLCGSPLWEETRNGDLYSLAKAMKVYARKLDIDLLGLILDEVHEDGAPNSKQGQAMGWMSDIFAKVLGMSGTFYGGMASSNFQIFFRLFKWFRSNWNIDEVSNFVSRYGNWRRTWKTSMSKEGWGTRVELPGVSPELISNYLINDIVYMSLQEAGFDLVPRTDYPLFVSPTAEERIAINRLMDDIKAKVETEGYAHEKKVQVSGSELAKLHVLPSGFHLHAFSTYSNAFRCSLCGQPKPICEHQWPVEDPEVSDEELVVEAEPMLDPEYFSAKELALVDLVRNEAREGRPCLVYVYHTGKYVLNTRLEYVLHHHGIRTLDVAIVRPDKLERTINNAADTGADAIIVNPVRAGTGLNLIATPTVIFYQTVWSVLTMMQGAARSHRPTQTTPVRVYYLVTKGTVEEVILGRVIERMAAIFLASGGDNEGMAAVFDAVGHQETLTELLVSYVSRNVQYDLASIFEELNGAQRDLLPERQVVNETIKHPSQNGSSPEDFPDIRGAEQLTIF